MMIRMLNPSALSAAAALAALVLASCDGGGDSITSPDSAAARGRGQTDVLTVSSDTDADPPDTGGSNDVGDQIVYDDPVAAVRAFESAYNDRDAGAMQALLGGRFQFRTHPPLGFPPAFSRREVLSSLSYMLGNPDVELVSLSMELGAAEPAGDLEHPDWVEVPIEAATLIVTFRSEFGGSESFVVPGDPGRFVLGRGPAFSDSTAGWQIMSQWDLHESGSDDGSERDVAMTWSEVLHHFMGAAADAGSSGPGL